MNTKTELYEVFLVAIHKCGIMFDFILLYIYMCVHVCVYFFFFTMSPIIFN